MKRNYHVSLDVQTERDRENLELYLDGLLASGKLDVDSIWVTPT